jgi:hypothetical protein
MSNGTRLEGYFGRLPAVGGCQSKVAQGQLGINGRWDPIFKADLAISNASTGFPMRIMSIRDDEPLAPINLDPA